MDVWILSRDLNYARQSGNTCRKMKRKNIGKCPRRMPLELKMTKRKKDPGAPLRPLSAYMWFCKRNWKKVAKANPGKGTSKVVQLLARMWTSSTEDKKKIYEEYAECDKKFYDIEKEKYLKQKKAIKLKGGHI
ncbi:Nonhistone chromosomal protein, putative [Pediculus humanus corporis]|uniref:Nonhistone chromosomal protein, putative n=1 Tax=Pediculus humanus subsp. corporis TaxID=121224 RepID=E0VNX2_PEDHC|nr:Nonhistone chromosomal protein, putative [Pediculus humanus corporis]EEB15078.1 Nonhistone chromosomal protein, putative [Pediculus humanus corporis]